MSRYFKVLLGWSFAFACCAVSRQAWLLPIGDLSQLCFPAGSRSPNPKAFSPPTRLRIYEYPVCKKCPVASRTLVTCRVVKRVVYDVWKSRMDDMPWLEEFFPEAINLFSKKNFICVGPVANQLLCIYEDVRSYIKFGVQIFASPLLISTIPRTSIITFYANFWPKIIIDAHAFRELVPIQ